jgi:hypothetical protein
LYTILRVCWILDETSLVRRATNKKSISRLYQTAHFVIHPERRLRSFYARIEFKIFCCPTDCVRPRVVKSPNQSAGGWGIWQKSCPSAHGAFSHMKSRLPNWVTAITSPVRASEGILFQSLDAAHQSSLNPGNDPPSASQVCDRRFCSASSDSLGAIRKSCVRHSPPLTPWHSSAVV